MIGRYAGLQKFPRVISGAVGYKVCSVVTTTSLLDEDRLKKEVL
jgi:hypothetical protein